MPEGCSVMPQDGRARRRQLRFVIDADGKVAEDSVDIIAAWSKLLGDAAAEAVTDIAFIPGKKDGSAVSSVVMMPIRYAFQ